MSTRILVVEDNPANLELLSDWLDIEGFTVEAAETLSEAFEILRKNRFDTILLDVQLGTEDGLELARWIRRNPELRGTPIIAVTAHAMITDQERVIREGCNACIPKPINFQELKEYLASIVLDHDLKR